MKNRFLHSKPSHPIFVISTTGLRIFFKMTKGTGKARILFTRRNIRDLLPGLEGMDFDPKSSILSSQEVNDYLIRYCGRVLSMIVKFCPATMDVKVVPLAGGVYFHPQVLSLGVQLPLTSFVRSVLGYYQVLPLSLRRTRGGRSWLLKSFTAPMLPHTGLMCSAPPM